MRGRGGLSEVESVKKKRPPGGSTAMGKTFRAFDSHQILLLFPALNKWLPGNYLVRFLAHLVDEVSDLGSVLADRTEKRG